MILFAGDETNCGDGGPALQARLSHPKGIVIAADRTMYIADGTNIRAVDPNVSFLFYYYEIMFNIPLMLMCSLSQIFDIPICLQILNLLDKYTILSSLNSHLNLNYGFSI